MGRMEKIVKAIANVGSTRGSRILSRNNIFCALLDDLVPEQVEERQFIKMIYSDEIGRILYHISETPSGDNEKLYEELDKHLQSKCRLIEPARRKFIQVFRDAFKHRTVKVPKFKDY
jgi:hypothetical protein